MVCASKEGKTWFGQVGSQCVSRNPILELLGERESDSTIKRHNCSSSFLSTSPRPKDFYPKRASHPRTSHSRTGNDGKCWKQAFVQRPKATTTAKEEMQLVSNFLLLNMKMWVCVIFDWWPTNTPLSSHPSPQQTKTVLQGPQATCKGNQIKSSTQRKHSLKKY